MLIRTLNSLYCIRHCSIFHEGSFWMCSIWLQHIHTGRKLHSTSADVTVRATRGSYQSNHCQAVGPGPCRLPGSYILKTDKVLKHNVLSLLCHIMCMYFLPFSLAPNAHFNLWMWNSWHQGDNAFWDFNQKMHSNLAPSTDTEHFLSRTQQEITQ